MCKNELFQSSVMKNETYAKFRYENNSLTKKKKENISNDYLVFNLKLETPKL